MVIRFCLYIKRVSKLYYSIYINKSVHASPSFALKTKHKEKRRCQKKKHETTMHEHRHTSTMRIGKLVIVKGGKIV